jgi:DNA-binding NarL/FixJ family response regulator
LKTLLVTQDPATSIGFAEALRAESAGPILRALAGPEALEMATSAKPDLVIIDTGFRDEQCRGLVRKLLTRDAFINVAVVSPLKREAFQRAYQGLGILCQLPPRPGRREALALIQRYRRVTAAA